MKYKYYKNIHNENVKMLLWQLIKITKKNK